MGSCFWGGYNQSVNPDIGSAVFVVDLENEGRLLKVIDIEDKKESSYTKRLHLKNKIF